MRRFARRSVSVGLGVAAMLLPVQVFLGDQVASHLFPDQPSKAEAAEGNWAGTNTGWVVFAIPDQQAQRNIVEVSLPCIRRPCGSSSSRRARPHRTLKQAAPSRPLPRRPPTKIHKIQRHDRLAGILHEYQQVA
jgi:cytochrome bd-type quinol oxidase subunit 1